MTNQVVINFLNQVRKILLDDKSWLESTIQPINEAFDKAISALKKQDALDTNVGNVISRQAAIDVIEAGRLTKLIDAETAVNGLKALPPAQPEQRWIPFTERPPKKGQKCLVSDKGNVVIDVFWGKGGAYNWQFYTRDYEAWMPCPEPYSAERRTDSDG